MEFFEGLFRFFAKCLAVTCWLIVLPFEIIAYIFKIIKDAVTK